MQQYNKLRESGQNLEVIFISFDRDEKGFKEHYNSMPWLGVPFDVNLHKRLSKLYHVDHIPKFIPLGSDGKKSVEEVEDAVELIEDYGADAFPFDKKRKEELKALDEGKRLGGKLEQLLLCEGRNYLIDGLGREVVYLLFLFFLFIYCQYICSNMFQMFKQFWIFGCPLNEWKRFSYESGLK